MFSLSSQGGQKVSEISVDSDILRCPKYGQPLSFQMEKMLPLSLSGVYGHQSASLAVADIAVTLHCGPLRSLPGAVPGK